MVDPGETAHEAAVREFIEEAMEDLEIANIDSNQLLSKGEIVKQTRNF